MSGRKRYHEVPDKNFYSHISDALQYAILHIREGLMNARENRVIITKQKNIENPDLGAWN